MLLLAIGAGLWSRPAHIAPAALRSSSPLSPSSRWNLVRGFRTTRHSAEHSAPALRSSPNPALDFAPRRQGLHLLSSILTACIACRQESRTGRLSTGLARVSSEFRRIAPGSADGFMTAKPSPPPGFPGGRPASPELHRRLLKKTFPFGTGARRELRFRDG